MKEAKELKQKKRLKEARLLKKLQVIKTQQRKCLKIVTFEGTINSEIMEIKSVIARLNKGDLKIMMESSTKENDQSDFWSDQQGWKIVTWRLYEACGVYILELEDGTVIHMCLLIQSSLLDSFWAEATVTTAYRINRSPSKTLEKKTHIDLWSGHSTNYEMLRIFGCIAYLHVNQGKLKPRAIKWEGILMDTLKGVGTADYRKEVEFEVELQGSNVSLSRPSGFLVEDDMPTYAFFIAVEEDTHELITFQEAIYSSEKDEWIKERIEGVQKPRYKARLVAQGITQRARIDYNEIYSHVVWHTSIRVILSFTACEDYELEQLDLKTVFLHGNLEETIYTSNRKRGGGTFRSGDKVGEASRRRRVEWTDGVEFVFDEDGGGEVVE
ncbi:retrotransposon protein, putative, ty1-copia subclass [Tanacetum coccineum]